MIDDSLSDTQQESRKDFISRPDGPDIYLGPFAKEVWNLAIEAAANEIDDMGEEARISEYIRERLKK